MLIDTIGPPYRYSDDNIVSVLNLAMGEISRVRSDLFMDAKYQRPLPSSSPIDDGMPGLYTSINQAATVTVPRQYYQSVLWYIEGILQWQDMDDTQDVRAQMFHQKFLSAILSEAA
jgi:hypothetical protein